MLCDLQGSQNQAATCLHSSIINIFPTPVRSLRKKCVAFQLAPSSHHKKFHITWQCVKHWFDKYFIFCISVSTSSISSCHHPSVCIRPRMWYWVFLQEKAKTCNREQWLSCQTFCFRGLLFSLLSHFFSGSDWTLINGLEQLTQTDGQNIPSLHQVTFCSNTHLFSCPSYQAK